MITDMISCKRYGIILSQQLLKVIVKDQQLAHKYIAINHNYFFNLNFIKLYFLYYFLWEKEIYKSSY